MQKKEMQNNPPTGCFVVMILNLLLGGWSFDYCLWAIFGKDIPFWGDMICGFFAGEVTIPLAIVCFILRCCGIESPFLH